jgi:hypothetical protein
MLFATEPRSTPFNPTAHDKAQIHAISHKATTRTRTFSRSGTLKHAGSTQPRYGTRSIRPEPKGWDLSAATSRWSPATREGLHPLPLLMAATTLSPPPVSQVCCLAGLRPHACVRDHTHVYACAPTNARKLAWATTHALAALVNLCACGCYAIAHARRVGS